jgi:AraC-like DNA-binding protein
MSKNSGALPRPDAQAGSIEFTLTMPRRRIPLRLVDFRGEEPKHCANYRQLFGAPVRFGEPASRLAFDARYLTLPAMRDEASLRQFLRRAPANILVRYAYDAGLAAAIRRRLRPLPPSEWPDFPELARQLRMPASTLRHRLRQEAQTYRTIRDALRHQLALQWLDEGRLGAGSIAAELGFAGPARFTALFGSGRAQRLAHIEGGLRTASQLKAPPGSPRCPMGPAHRRRPTVFSRGIETCLECLPDLLLRQGQAQLRAARQPRPVTQCSTAWATGILPLASRVGA